MRKPDESGRDQPPGVADDRREGGDRREDDRRQGDETIDEDRRERAERRRRERRNLAAEILLPGVLRKDDD